MNTQNNEMSLQGLIKKYNMKEGDQVLCTDAKGFGHGTGIFDLRMDGCVLVITKTLYSGDGGQLFKLPDNSPYLKTTPKFVYSCQPNTAGNQEALFELGYSWPHRGNSISHLDSSWLYTTFSGFLTRCNLYDDSVPKRYSFETKTVATLLPEEPAESETQREIRLATEELEAVTKRLQALKAKGVE